MSELNKREKEGFINQIQEIKNGANSGDKDCQTAYGKCLLFGWGVEKDEKSAFDWFSKASEQGDQIAGMYLGHCYLYGIGAGVDESKGYHLLNAALDFNYPDEGESQNQSQQSAFSHDDLCQLFLDLGDAFENSLGIYRKYRSAVYYFDMLNDWGEPIGGERKSHYKKTLFGWKKKD